MINNCSGFISDAREISDKLSEAEQLQNCGIFVIHCDPIKCIHFVRNYFSKTNQ